MIISETAVSRPNTSRDQQIIIQEGRARSARSGFLLCESEREARGVALYILFIILSCERVARGVKGEWFHIALYTFECNQCNYEKRSTFKCINWLLFVIRCIRSSYLLGLLAKIKCSISSSQPDLWDLGYFPKHYWLGRFLKPSWLSFVMDLILYGQFTGRRISIYHKRDLSIAVPLRVAGIPSNIKFQKWFSFEIHICSLSSIDIFKWIGRFRRFNIWSHCLMAQPSNCIDFWFIQSLLFFFCVFKQASIVRSEIQTFFSVHSFWSMASVSEKAIGIQSSPPLHTNETTGSIAVPKRLSRVFSSLHAPPMGQKSGCYSPVISCGAPGERCQLMICSD